MKAICPDLYFQFSDDAGQFGAIFEALGAACYKHKGVNYKTDVSEQVATWSDSEYSRQAFVGFFAHVVQTGSGRTAKKGLPSLPITPMFQALPSHKELREMVRCQFPSICLQVMWLEFSTSF